MIRWGGDYSGRIDSMHFEVNASAAKVAAVAVKLRAGAAPAFGSTPLKFVAPDVIVGNQVKAPFSLKPGMRLVNNDVAFVMQTDGQPVLYWKDKPIWAAGKYGQTLELQADGNLVLYRDGKAIWTSGSNQANAGVFLALQSDGNLVLYILKGGTQRAAWATNTYTTVAKLRSGK